MNGENQLLVTSQPLHLPRLLAQNQNSTKKKKIKPYFGEFNFRIKV